MAVTHQDIADKVGLSRAIVTQALHRSRSVRVSTETRRLVQQAADEMGYQHRARTTHTVGYVVQLESLASETEGLFMTWVEAALRARGYRISLVGVDSQPFAEIGEMVSAKMVDGVLIRNWHHGQVREVISEQVPFVAITDEDGIGDGVDVVTTDPYLTAQHIVNHLLERSHSRLALMTTDLGNRYYRLVREGAEYAVLRSGLPGVHLQIVRGKVADIPNQVTELMSGTAAPTAIIVDDLFHAAPVLYALRDHGYRIPSDISMVSLCDSVQFPAMCPVLTATDQHRPELAERAVERLLQKIHQPETIPTKTLLAGQILERGSVGPPSCTQKNNQSGQETIL